MKNLLINLFSRGLLFTFFASVTFFLSCGEKETPKPVDEIEEPDDNPDDGGNETPDPTDITDADFYTAPTTFGVTKNLVDDYGVNNSDTGDDSQKMQQAIDEISATADGGKLIIPAGDYYLLSIDLKSNVHIEIDQSATIFPASVAGGNHRIFQLAFTNKDPIENVSIVGTGEGFTIDYRQTNDDRLASFYLGSVTNFKISNFKIQDTQTVFANILVAFTSTGGGYDWPENGIIEKASSFNSDKGYGLVQMYAADNILFRDIHVTGGVTLRMETDNLTMKDAGLGGIRDIYAENVSGEDCMAAVMFSPHFQENGKVEVNGVSVESCGFAVRIDEGFVEIFSDAGVSKSDHQQYIANLLGSSDCISTIYLRGNNKDRWAARIKNECADALFQETGLKPGTYADSDVFAVSAEYGTNSDLTQHWPAYLSCSERDQVCKYSGADFKGPSVGGKYDNNTDSEYAYKINVYDIALTGFPEDRESITEDTPDSGCPSVSWPTCN